jgi:hypothetical protein
VKHANCSAPLAQVTVKSPRVARQITNNVALIMCGFTISALYDLHPMEDFDVACFCRLSKFNSIVLAISMIHYCIRPLAKRKTN